MGGYHGTQGTDHIEVPGQSKGNVFPMANITCSASKSSAGIYVPPSCDMGQLQSPFLDPGKISSWPHMVQLLVPSSLWEHLVKPSESARAIMEPGGCSLAVALQPKEINFPF